MKISGVLKTLEKITGRHTCKRLKMDMDTHTFIYDSFLKSMAGHRIKLIIKCRGIYVHETLYPELMPRLLPAFWLKDIRKEKE